MKQEQQFYVPSNIAKKSTHYFEDKSTVTVQGIVLSKKKLDALFSLGTISQFKKTITELAKKDEILIGFSQELIIFLPAVIEYRNASFNVKIPKEENGSKSISMMNCLLQIDFTRLQELNLTSQELVSLEAMALINMPLVIKIFLNMNKIKNYQPLSKSNFPSLQQLTVDCSPGISKPIQRMQNYQLIRYNFASEYRKTLQYSKGNRQRLQLEPTFKFWFDRDRTQFIKINQKI